MPILAAKTYKKFGHQGFSIVEILVALLLVSLIFLAIPTGDTTFKHRKLQESIDDIDRSIRFASNESILRNVVVRLKIDFEKTPVEYSIEAGPKGELVLPEFKDTQNLSLDEVKREKEKKKTFDGQFSPVEDFKDVSRPISQEVKLEGIATTAQKALQSEGAASIYFFPSGEKDEALFVFSTDFEVATLEIEAFQEDTKAKYHTLPMDEVAQLKQKRENKVEEVYKEWIKP